MNRKAGTGYLRHSGRESIIRREIGSPVIMLLHRFYQVQPVYQQPARETHEPECRVDSTQVKTRSYPHEHDEDHAETAQKNDEGDCPNTEQEKSGVNQWLERT